MGRSPSLSPDVRKRRIRRSIIERGQDRDLVVMRVAISSSSSNRCNARCRKRRSLPVLVLKLKLERIHRVVVVKVKQKKGSFGGRSSRDMMILHRSKDIQEEVSQCDEEPDCGHDVVLLSVKGIVLKYIEVISLLRGREVWGGEIGWICR